MELFRRMRKYKRILAAVIIILLVACVEAGFNFPALSEGYEELDLSPYIETEGEGEDRSYVVEYPAPEGLYVKQLKIRGSFSGGEYTVQCTVQNEFGREEEYLVTDDLHSWFTEFYTNLNQRITSIKITLPRDGSSELWAVSVSNQPELNKYRVVFTFLILVLLYCIFFEQGFRKKPEYFFLVFSLAFGGFLLLGGQTRCNGWDEQIHFQNAYRLASGRTVEWSEAAELMGAAKSVPCNTKAEYAQLRNVMDEKGNTITMVEERTDLGLSFYTFGYVPSALFLKLGMGMNLSFSSLILFGRMGNLLAYILVMFWAIRLAKPKKLFLLFIAMMPTPLFLACSYTYDSTAFSFVTLGVVLWANEMSVPKDSYGKGSVAASLLLMAFGGMTKLVYLPLVLIWILAPQIRRISKKKKMAAGAGIFVLCVIVGLFVLNRWLLPILSGEVLVGDLRGGETSVAGQLFSMLEHPWATVKMFVRDILSLDNFRNSGIEAYNNFFVGNLMFLNYYLLGVMPDKWCLLLLPVLVVLLLYREEETEKRKLPGKGQQAFVLVLLALIVAAIWGSLYLVFTPVGDTQIAGVQARYYLPLLYPAALMIRNKKMYIQAGYEVIAKIAMVAALVLAGVSMYDFILKCRLF